MIIPHRWKDQAVFEAGAETMCALVEAGVRVNADLRGATLDGADLREATLDGADLREANLILGGQDMRGYRFTADRDAAGYVHIKAGCRHFVGFQAAYAHWNHRHLDDPVLHADCLSLVDRLYRMALVRGWIEEEVK